MTEIDIYVKWYHNSWHDRDVYDSWEVNFVPRIGEHIEMGNKSFLVYHIVHTKTKVKVYVQEQRFYQTSF